MKWSFLHSLIIMWFLWRVVIFHVDLQLSSDQSWVTVISHLSGHSWSVQGWAPDINQDNLSLFWTRSQREQFALGQVCSLPCEKSLSAETGGSGGMFGQVLDFGNAVVSAFPMVWSRCLLLWNPSKNFFTLLKLAWFGFLSLATKEAEQSMLSATLGIYGS